MLLIDNFVNTKYENITIDLSMIEISLDFYFRNNYKEAMFSNNLEKEIEIDNHNMISFGQVN